MIEIIERHDPKEFEPKYKFTCSKCHSVAIITEDEIKLGSQYNEVCAYFQCPVCRTNYNGGNSRRDILKRAEFEEHLVR
jgi:hypothetical protein